MEVEELPYILQEEVAVVLELQGAFQKVIVVAKFSQLELEMKAELPYIFQEEAVEVELCVPLHGLRVQVEYP